MTKTRSNQQRRCMFDRPCILTEKLSKAPHSLPERKIYFETLLENLRNSRISELRDYSLEPDFDNKLMYEMTLKSKYPYKHKSYLGERVFRRLFKSSKGFINADLN